MARMARRQLKQHLPGVTTHAFNPESSLASPAFLQPSQLQAVRNPACKQTRWKNDWERFGDIKLCDPTQVSSSACTQRQRKVRHKHTKKRVWPLLVDLNMTPWQYIAYVCSQLKTTWFSIQILLHKFLQELYSLLPKPGKCSDIYQLSSR